MKTQTKIGVMLMITTLLVIVQIILMWKGISFLYHNQPLDHQENIIFANTFFIPMFICWIISQVFCIFIKKQLDKFKNENLN